jgi:glutathione synthase/RimK-type ligase-like ATP-grasp enzyme
VKLSRTRRYMLLKNLAKRVTRRPSWPDPADDSLTMPSAPPVLLDWPAGVPKPRVGLVKDGDVFPYWTKYRNFLEANEIPYRLYDIHRSTWLEEAAELDFVVWRPMSFPYELEECRRKFHVLERHLGKLCHPSFDEALLYEDKILQHYLLTLHGLPVAETFVSHSAAEARRHLATRAYPAVWKLTTGSGSWGVELAPDAATALDWGRDVFSFSGRSTYWPFLGQKNYVYVQRLEPNQGFDVRVIVVGDKVFGYYRDVPQGEYRASGMGLVRKEALPRPAVLVARRAAEALGMPCLAVDCIIDPSGARAIVIEVSSFIQMETPEQMVVDGEPGWLEGDDLRFVPGQVWVQEETLACALRARWLAPRITT